MKEKFHTEAYVEDTNKNKTTSNYKQKKKEYETLMVNTLCVLYLIPKNTLNFINWRKN